MDSDSDMDTWAELVSCCIRLSIMFLVDTKKECSFDCEDIVHEGNDEPPLEPEAWLRYVKVIFAHIFHATHYIIAQILKSQRCRAPVPDSFEVDSNGA
jgi:hypothetical protein